MNAYLGTVEVRNACSASNSEPRGVVGRNRRARPLPAGAAGAGSRLNSLILLGIAFRHRSAPGRDCRPPAESSMSVKTD